MRVSPFLLVVALAAGCTKGPNYPLPSPSPLPDQPSSIPSVDPPQSPLVISLTYGPIPARAGSETALVAGIAPQPTAPVHYVWTFGDGSTLEESRNNETLHSLVHRYAVGSYTVALTVTDGHERTGTTEIQVPVVAAPIPPPLPPPPAPLPIPIPVLNVTLACTPQTALIATTTCNVAADFNGLPVPSADITSVAWEWGDGTAVTALPGPIATHTYGFVGTYRVIATVTATTSAGPKTAAVLKTIEVQF